MNRIVRSSITIALLGAIAAFAALPAQAEDGRTGALLGGVAVGAVGGVLLGQALANHPAPPPRYIEPAPVAYDPYFDELRHLHAGCDRGSRRACITFGEFIGVHKEREDMWRHTYPEFFQWDGY